MALRSQSENRVTVAPSRLAPLPMCAREDARTHPRRPSRPSQKQKSDGRAVLPKTPTPDAVTMAANPGVALAPAPASRAKTDCLWSVNSGRSRLLAGCLYIALIRVLEPPCANRVTA
jgi:hypothetical protein